MAPSVEDIVMTIALENDTAGVRMSVRVAALAYGVGCYLIFLACLGYAVVFVGGFLPEHSLDGPRSAALPTAMLIDLALLALFAIQHSVMARPAFKRWWVRHVPEALERSTYVLLSSLALFAVFVFWQPLGGVVWQLEKPLFMAVFYGGYAFGWVLVLTASLSIDHFDLFGLRQVWFRFMNEPYRPVVFRAPFLYRLVRHPLYLGWLFVFWSTPTMTISHLCFAVAMTVYLFVGIWFEERDLARAHPEYAAYKARTPMILPIPRRSFREDGRPGK